MARSAPVGVESAPTRAEAFYRPGLDILRALAFLLVFVAHGLILHLDRPTRIGVIARSGEFGVCVFFFLSAYLITELLLREKAQAGAVSVRAFYVRRVLRIWPLYFAMIGFGVFYGLLVPKFAVSARWNFALTLLYANWYTIGHGYPPGFLLPLWSIAVEEQFYLVWPWLMKHLGPKMLVGLACAVILAAYATVAIGLHRGQSLDPGLWANSFVQFQFFGLGALTALVLRGRRLDLPIAARWGFLVSGLLSLAGAQAAVFPEDVRLLHDFPHVAPRYGLVLAACLCLFLAFLPARGISVWEKAGVYLGKISYGLYVYHLLWLSIAGHIVKRMPGAVHGLPAEVASMTLALVGTVVTAMLSYRYLESPFLRWKKRFTVVPSRAI